MPCIGEQGVSVDPSESMLVRTLSSLGFDFYFMCMGVSACMYVCTVCACSHKEDQKMALDPLKMELQTVVSCYAGAGNTLQH